ncbi:hypothetical protein F5Y00DRAFT_230813 [Daldinia vernicosa]|uniref:uncharacterized protein n=1 Tax=Daldinia vernicosa TaxID=114800 RepID=UPI002007AF4D|nr:uncharacterized protein F5Y00DRAFT_230813 [Daldinia vernicosa]KAI0851274.1 hypothetical protein F5Y00DRAFT_230813 [Daldinia vernicosa]
MLSLHLQRESQRWAAQRQSYPASPSSLDSSSSYEDEDSDCESVFSTSSSRSRWSSVSSEAPDDEPAPAAFEQPRDFNGAPITMYTSLEQAVTQSTQTAEAQGPRRLVTPGKLYENEDDDDEIVEWAEEKDGSVTTEHAEIESGFSRIAAGSVIPAS